LKTIQASDLEYLGKVRQRHDVSVRGQGLEWAMLKRECKGVRKNRRPVEEGGSDELWSEGEGGRRKCSKKWGVSGVGE